MYVRVCSYLKVRVVRHGFFKLGLDRIENRLHKKIYRITGIGSWTVVGKRFFDT